MMTIMDRSVLYQINGLEKPQKISGFLKEKGYSRQNLVDLRKDEQAICLNGTYVHMNHMLAEGDVLTVWIRETENSGQIRPVKLPFAIVYEDEDLLVINKPAGMPVHPSRGNPENSLGNALAWYFKEQGVPFVFRCINRLDRDTSGLTIVAKHAVSAAILGQMVRAKAEQGLKAPGIHRTYLALVEGKVVPVSSVIDAPIARQEDRCLRRVVDFKRGDRAVTHYRVLTGWQTGNAQKFRSLGEPTRSACIWHIWDIRWWEIFFIIRHMGKIRLTVGTMKIPGRDRFFRERLFPVEKSNMILAVRHCMHGNFRFRIP